MELQVTIENPLIISQADKVSESYEELVYILSELYYGNIPESTVHWFVYKGGRHVAMHQQNVNGVFPERSIFIKWPQ